MYFSKAEPLNRLNVKIERKQFNPVSLIIIRPLKAISNLPNSMCVFTIPGIQPSFSSMVERVIISLVFM